MSRKPARVFLIPKGIALAACALLAAAAIFGVVHVPAAITAATAARQLPIYSVDRPAEDGKKYCAISFDAAWGNEDTQTLIDILHQYQVKATFFLVGDWVDKYPESVQALHEAGMEVMNHSNHHDHYNSLSTQQIIDDVTASNQRISAATGVTPTLIRCPYGEYDDHVIAAIRSMGMEPIQWDVDSLDWKDYDAETICKRVTSKVQPGSIVLFHNAALHTPEALPTILSCLINDGYTVVPISQLILDAPYTIDHTGRQFPAEHAG